MTQVKIYVQGGVVQAVYSDDANIQITLLDEDNMQEEMSNEEIRAHIKAETKGLKEIF